MWRVSSCTRVLLLAGFLFTFQAVYAGGIPAADPPTPIVERPYPNLPGAFIELQVEPPRPGLWTRMEWRDAAGSWREVDGWQGSFDEGSRVLWYAGRELLGAGPFRWLILATPQGALLAVSEPFNLPARGGEILRLTVPLVEPPPLRPRAAARIPTLAAAEPPPEMVLRVNYGHDWVESFYEPGHRLILTVTAADGVTVKATAELVTEPKDFWDGATGFTTTTEDWSPAPPDIQPGDWVMADVDNGARPRVQIGDIQAALDLEGDRLKGTVAAPWLGGPVDVFCEPWGSPEPLESQGQAITPDGQGLFACFWEGIWDIQPGQDVVVAYIDGAGHWVAVVLNLPALGLRVNLRDNWVEGFYEAGRQVTIQVTQPNGRTVKAEAHLITEVKDFFGGGSGFQTSAADWEPAPPDIEPGDWVSAVIDNGVNARTQIGEIDGAIDLEADRVDGTVRAPWFVDPVDIECHPWGSPVPVDVVLAAAAPDGSAPYACSWAGAWDIQAGQDVTVAYTGADGHWISDTFTVFHFRLRVNYDADWVESFYEAGHEVSLTVADRDGRVKAATERFTEPQEIWGGQPGFQTWAGDWFPGPPDIEPYDRVMAVLDGAETVEVIVGDIRGTVDLAADRIDGTVTAPWAAGEVSVECIPWGATGPVEPLVDVVRPDGLDAFSCSWAGAWDIQPRQAVGIGYVDPDGHWVATAFSADSARIIASIDGDWFRMEGFRPGVLRLWIYDTAAGGVPRLREGASRTDENGTATVGYHDIRLDLKPGHLLVVFDGESEKRLLLEPFTLSVFDPDSDLMAGTAPAGRSFRVYAGEESFQTPLEVRADGRGLWTADFKTIGFDLTEEMRAWSYAQLVDEDGDINEVSPPRRLRP